ncbi:hypothetical protein FIV42_26915 [Persicimonas caeni]|uniref:Uncharacterized protein n=1 Tax=Persicimonas caeni TaxID=2292766 RepID=A0A4Y6Q125_PERCE|nr:hypothetical protein [Persicimonas caeni]QDG54243.1 hypothetical protein FIV42_26915 [Persicimonas caeni]QED35464.1 hypothetical protein FRD00_26910 [Persicimonas caeni]
MTPRLTIRLFGLVFTVTVVGVGLLVPDEALCCSPSPSGFRTVPAEGEVAPPDTLLNLALIGPLSFDSYDRPRLLDSDGEEVALDTSAPTQALGEAAFERMVYAVSPSEQLSPGTYTIQLANPNQVLAETNFEVSDDIDYATPPTIASLEWFTRVYDSVQPARWSCNHDFQQQSLISFPRPRSSDDPRSLMYQVRLTAVGAFDGDIERTEGSTIDSRRFIYIDDVAADDYHGFGEIDGDIVRIATQTPFKAECIEVTAIDGAGQRGPTISSCVPDRCAPPETDLQSSDDWEHFEDIDWSAQPDCSQVYCYTGDCAPSPQPDAGIPADASSTDAGSTDVNSGPAPADASGSTPDTTGDAENSTNTSEEGCACTSVEAGRSPRRGLALAALLAGLLACRTASRKRRESSAPQS